MRNFHRNDLNISLGKFFRLARETLESFRDMLNGYKQQVLARAEVTLATQ